MNSARGTGPVPGTGNADPAAAGRRPTEADAGTGRESDQLRRAADELAQRGREGVGMTATTARFRQFELAQLLTASPRRCRPVRCCHASCCATPRTSPSTS